MPDKETASSRIAIKFGSSKGPSRPTPPSALGKRARPQLLGNASGSDSEGYDDDDRSKSKHEAITTIGGGEIKDGFGRGKHPAKEPLTIPRQANRDWKSEKRARTSAAPQPGVDRDVEPADKDKELKWGLTLTKKGGGAAAVASNKDMPRGSDDAQLRSDAQADGESQQKTADEEAMEALLDERKGGPRKELVIPRAGPAGASEEEAFKRDFHDAPEASTLEEYEAMPVEDFGAALLRGMGWDGKHTGPKIKEVKRRPNQMGLGAKDLKGHEDLGAWNQRGSSSRPRPKRLNDYKREERERQDKRSYSASESYKQERDRERYEERRNGHSHRRR